MSKSITQGIGYLLAAILCFYTSATGAASTGPYALQVAWPKIQLQEIPGSLTNPVHITHAGDGSGRIFIVEQEGLIHINKNGSLLSSPFLDIQSKVFFDGEQGLLSLAFPPNFSGKGYFYVYYTNHAGNNVVSRFYMSPNPDRADENREEIILILDHPNHDNHNGGQMVFGPDGYLYIGTGDGGGGGDPQGNAQNIGSLLGKILRIDVEFASRVPARGANRIYLPMTTGKGQGRRYRIPADNPFVNGNGAREEIWALGLRNPWRFSFDRSNGDLYIGDVGQNLYEEIDYQPASSKGGENYGWNVMEGSHCYTVVNCNQSGLVLPILEYSHGSGDSTGCSVTGGFIYRGPGNPGMQGMYFFGDYCSGIIWAADYQGNNWSSFKILDTNYYISTFGEDEAGNLYLADRSGGRMYRLVEIP